MTEQVLVLNSGSSSIKYTLFEVGPSLVESASGLVERIGESDSLSTHHVHVGDRSQTHHDRARIADHRAGFSALIEILETAGTLTHLTVIGHRVVHGGARFVAPTLIDDDVVAGIRANIPLAPLHNPANLTGIEAARRLRPDVDQVAVFDTAFHASLPERAYRYALPPKLAEKLGIRRYGFHGISHAYVARQAARHLDRPDAAIVTLHLGNGASATAVDAGRSVDTSMGMTPLQGLVMGTRSGDLDPAVIFHLVRQGGYDIDGVDELLNRGSGLLGLTGENDLRVIESRAAAGDADAALALDLTAYRIRQYLGAYTATLGRLDAVVFTAGIGENSANMRARSIEGLEVLGLRLDAERNRLCDVHSSDTGLVAIHAPDSTAAILVIATDEEREIALQSLTARDAAR